MDKFSYAIGLGIGQNLLSMGAQNINVEDFANAVKAVLENKETAITHNEAREIVNKYFEELEAKLNAQNIEKGKNFLIENAKRAGVVTLASGLQYEVIAEGNGKKPLSTDSVKCHYEGTLIDGTLFDSSVKRGEPAVFGVNQVIKGWVEALQLMSEGSKWRLSIPSELAYGAQQAGEMIPPHSTLIFDVELIEVL
jgi:FKBP-type peptidyl-prolyl cis-trans isomerase FklB